MRNQEVPENQQQGLASDIETADSSPPEAAVSQSAGLSAEARRRLEATIEERRLQRMLGGYDYDI